MMQTSGPGSNVCFHDDVRQEQSWGVLAERIIEKHID
jgi:hypothetical protein